MTTNFTVTNETELNADIRAIDVSGADAAQNTDYVINITGTIDLTTDLLAINLESGFRRRSGARRHWWPAPF